MITSTDPCGCRHIRHRSGREVIELCAPHAAEAVERHEASKATGWNADRRCASDAVGSRVVIFDAATLVRLT